MTVVKLPVKTHCHRHFDRRPHPDWVYACWDEPVNAGDAPSCYRVKGTDQVVPNGFYLLREQTGNCYVVAPRDLHSLYSPSRDETDLELCYRFLERHGYTLGSDYLPGDHEYVVRHQPNGWTAVVIGGGWGNWDDGMTFEADYDETGTHYASGVMGDANEEPI